MFAVGFTVAVVTQRRSWCLSDLSGFLSLSVSLSFRHSLSLSFSISSLSPPLTLSVLWKSCFGVSEKSHNRCPSLSLPEIAAGKPAWKMKISSLQTVRWLWLLCDVWIQPCHLFLSCALLVFSVDKYPGALPHLPRCPCLDEKANKANRVRGLMAVVYPANRCSQEGSNCVETNSSVCCMTCSAQGLLSLYTVSPAALVQPQHCSSLANSFFARRQLETPPSKCVEGTQLRCMIKWRLKDELSSMPLIP